MLLGIFGGQTTPQLDKRPQIPIGEVQLKLLTITGHSDYFIVTGEKGLRVCLPFDIVRKCNCPLAEQDIIGIHTDGGQRQKWTLTFCKPGYIKLIVEVDADGNTRMIAPRTLAS